MRNLNFSVQKGDIFVVMGGSGCGKSTLLKVIIGLNEPLAGKVMYGGVSFWDADPAIQLSIMRRFGVLYQGGALWSSLNLAENIALPLEMYTDLSPKQIREVISLKLSLVGLSGYEEFYPSEISGGMRKRAGLARAMALDPDILFFDEPSAGLDPISARLLDELILQLCDTLGATVVLVTHELASIFAVGNNSIFLDADAKTAIASGHPKQLLRESQDPRVINFLTRGEKITGSVKT
jgi:phospholipid/cholesterol/gamma-HCH transport system ATP-binding protein